jgi:hypothetical protein
VPDRSGEDRDDDLVGLPPHTCVGGWREVTDEYARHLAPDDPIKQAALRNTVYPCKQCKPKQFFRWVEGHYAAGHEPEACDGCRDQLGIKGKRVHA